jgi:ankyrin repeat protein
MTGEAKADWGRSFWRAVSHGDVDQVRECLAVGVDPDLAASGHYRPLMAAAARADLEMVRLLLGAGADVHGHARCATPLLSAAQAGSEAIYRLLLAHGAQETAWTAAALGRDIGDERVDGLDESGATLLHVAARALQVRVCRTLLDRGAAPDARDRRGNTPLHAACDNRSPDPKAQIATLRLLHERGADADAPNKRGVRPLHIAVRARSLPAVGFLLEHEVNVDARDAVRGSPPLRRAVTNTGAGGTSGRGDTALEIARLLLDAGADPRAQDSRGRTILDAIRTPAMRMLVESYL